MIDRPIESTKLTEFEQQIQLFAPRYLNPLKERMIKEAQELRNEGALRHAWSSIRQANWLAEVAARAVQVADIIEHLDIQGERWKDTEKKPPLAEKIRRTIDQRLHAEVERALKSAGEAVAMIRRDEDRTDWEPAPEQVAGAQLSLARDYIKALVTWHRIDEKVRVEEEGDRL